MTNTDPLDSIIIKPTQPPPIPFTAWVKPVYVLAIPASSSLRYVFNAVISGERGCIGFDDTNNHLILYMQVEEIDHIHFPDLEVGVEMWACFKMKDGVTA